MDFSYSEEWLVLKDGELWSDRFDEEEDCIEHIKVSAIKLGIGEERFEYRPMTRKEIAMYDVY